MPSEQVAHRRNVSAMQNKVNKIIEAEEELNRERQCQETCGN